MTRFDLHIIRRLITGYVLLVLALIVFFIVLHYVEYVDDFMDRGATQREVFLVYYPSYIPDIVRLTSPLAAFLSCIYLTGRLAQELQVVALQAAGVSLYRLLVPYALVALVLTGSMFYFNGWVVPRTNAAVLQFELRYLKKTPAGLDVADLYRQNGPGSVVAVGYYDREAQTAHRVSLQTFEGGYRLRSRTDAARMEWVDSLGTWRLTDALERTFLPDGAERRRRLPLLDTLLTVRPADLARTERDVESMTIPAASGFIENTRRSGTGGIERMLVAYHGKFSYPFANLILVLLGLPLASVRRRGGQAVQIGLGMLVAFGYLAVMKLIEPFGYSGELSPALAAWLPHALFLVLALTLLLRARK